MTIRNPADNMELKDVILRGVIDDNRRMTTAAPASSSPRRRSGKSAQASFLSGSLFLLLALSMAGIFFMQQRRDNAPPLVAETASPVAGMPITTVEVQIPVEVPVPVKGYTPQTSFVMKPPESLPVDFSSENVKTAGRICTVAALLLLLFGLVKNMVKIIALLLAALILIMILASEGIIDLPRLFAG